MKTKLSFRAQCLATLAAAVMVAGCVPEAHTDNADGKQITAPLAAPPADPGAPPADPAVAQPPGAAQSNSVAVIKKFDPEAVKLSTGIQEIMTLAQAGVSESVIKAFIEKSNIPYNPTAEEIIFLTDIGLPNTVITAMLQQGNKVREQTARTAPAPAAVAAPAAPAISNAPVVPPAPTVQYVAAPAAPAVVVQPPPTSEATQFYSSLAPYGTWMNDSEMGWCWQPQVAAFRSDWRPYGDRGRWLHSDLGWYWQSDYSWGWAPFHYGRWTRHHRIGWVWTPGSVWGPAWVTWRYNDGYCGWAPLPYQAQYRSGLGLLYRGSSVAIGFDFGLSWNHFTFIASDRFVDNSPYSHYLPASRVQNIYQQTTVINNYNTINNTVINNGIPTSHIPAVARREVRKVAVQEWNPATQTHVAPDRIQQSGATPVIYRPQTPKAMAQAAENPGSRAHTELAKRAIVTTEQRLAIPASSITTTGQRLGTPASGITTTGQKLGTPAGSITTTPQRPLVTPAAGAAPTGQHLGTPASSITTTGQRLVTPAGSITTTPQPVGTPAGRITTTGQQLGTPAGTITTTPQRPLVTPGTPAAPGSPHPVAKPITPTVTVNPTPSAPTGAATTVRPFDQPAGPRPVVTPRAAPMPGLQHSNPVAPRSESPRLPIYTPLPTQPNPTPTPTTPRSESPRPAAVTPQPSPAPAGRPSTSYTPPPSVPTPAPARPAPSYTVPPARESQPFQPKQVEAQPRIIRPAPSSDVPSSGRPSGVSPGTDRSRPAPDRDPANPNKRQ